MPRRIITITISEDGNVTATHGPELEAHQMIEASEFASANLGLHTKPWQLDDLLDAVRREITRGSR